MERKQVQNPDEGDEMGEKKPPRKYKENTTQNSSADSLKNNIILYM